MSKKFGEHADDKYIEKLAPGKYRLTYTGGGQTYRYTLEDARYTIRNTQWQYKVVKKKITFKDPKPVVTAKSKTEGDFPMEVRYGGVTYKLESNIDIHFDEDTGIVYIKIVK